ncbi:apolipoprotein A1/A4/E family protein [Saccharothrix violaceirubra]|uniref:DNA repair exonuclease SbcCD ATPase subunit n=1 Tax=Saccharothrix violaceirubra TaxID=413306 RepID=A0A7W7WTC3_9PSEU|nr:apolipoprotein A1/A4/E family protein [Saccharothrix violaceirubra]MBB4963061.1 DNA repair exonuclease SbcCD ATPase subunit [Saccharothrix violaceirubra]
MSFDRMRNMLTRAAEIRESEQQQIFDALDEIHARMSPLETLGSVRKRLSELPDRTEVGVLAERLDEALSRLESQDQAVQEIGRAVEGLVDKLAKPFAQLDGRLDGVAGRFEGVAGRMDGLEDKLSHIHKRLDDLDLHLDKQDGKTDAVPSLVTAPLRERIEALEAALRGRLDEVDEGVHEHLDGTREALARSVADASTSLSETVVAARDAVSGAVSSAQDSLTSAVRDSRDSVHGRLDETRESLRAALDETRDQVDATDRLEALAQRLEQVTSRLDTMTSRLDSVEDDFASRIAELSGVVSSGISAVEGTLSARPDSDSLAAMVRKSNQESELRIGGQLDEAMATFAELILGGGPATPPPPPTALPRPQRRTRKGPKDARVDDDDLTAEGA